MKKSGKFHSMDTVFVLILFCVFALAVLLSLIVGTKAYSAISARTEESYYRRTALSYITEKLRHADEGGGVYLSNFNSLPALELREELDGVSHSVYIYCYNGEVCELFCETGLQMPTDAGNKIIAGSALSFEKHGGDIIEVIYTDPKGREGSCLVALRSGEAVG